MKAWWPLVFLALMPFPSPVKGQIPGPRRIRFKVLGPGKLQVSWKEPKGEYDGYRFIYNSAPGGERNELRMAKGENKAIIHDFNPTKEYTVKVMTVRGSQQSRALHAKYVAKDSQLNGESTQLQRLKDTLPTQDPTEISGACAFVCVRPRGTAGSARHARRRHRAERVGM